jgi:S1-C subfamily serine protease
MSTTPRTTILAAIALASVAAGCRSTDPTHDVAAAGDVYRVEIEACAGPDIQRATAMALTTDLVATAAHSFDGARGVILRDEEGAELEADVVYADFDKDIALLTVGSANDRIHTLGQPVVDSDVSLRTYADLDGVETKSGSILRLVDATLDGEGQRSALELAADIQRGDSGAPVINQSGEAVGMVFAASRVGERGWAVAAEELVEALDTFDEQGDVTPLSFCRADTE